MNDNIFKVWGERRRIFLNDKCEIDVLYINKNSFCSTHSHIAKINKFVVVSGCLEIQTTYGTKVLNKNEDFTVEPPLIHRFKALEDSVVVELAYIQEGTINPEDIKRIEQGGKIINGTEFTLEQIEKQGLK